MQEVEVFRKFLEENRGNFVREEDIRALFELRKLLDDVLMESLAYSSSSLNWMSKELKKESASAIIQALSKEGYRLRKELGDDFRKMGYRILEQIRTGKRSDVEYSITRIFIVNGKTLPSVLVEAFKPRYDDDTFKAFMYVFLGSVVGENQDQEVSDE